MPQPKELKPRHTQDISPKELLSIYEMRVRRNELHLLGKIRFAPDETENARPLTS